MNIEKWCEEELCYGFLLIEISSRKAQVPFPALYINIISFN